MSAQASRGGLTYPLRCGQCGADFIFSLITNTTSLAMRPLSAADLARPVARVAPPPPAPAESVGLDLASFTQSDPPPLPPLRPADTLDPVPAARVADVPDLSEPVAVPDTLDPDAPRPHPSTVSFAINLAPVPPERSTVSFLRPDLPPEADAVVAEFSTHGGGHAPTDSASRPVPPTDSSIARPAPNPTEDMPVLSAPRPAPPPPPPIVAAPVTRPAAPRITPVPAPPPPPARQDFIWVDPPDAVESVFGEVAPESLRPAPPPPTEGVGTGAWEPVSLPVTAPPPPAAPPPPPRPPAAPIIPRVQASDAARGWGALVAIVLATAVAVGAVAAVAIVLLRPPAAGP